jgi:hypothetical protein
MWHRTTVQGEVTLEVAGFQIGIQVQLLNLHLDEWVLTVGAAGEYDEDWNNPVSFYFNAHGIDEAKRLVEEKVLLQALGQLTERVEGKLEEYCSLIHHHVGHHASKGEVWQGYSQVWLAPDDLFLHLAVKDGMVTGEITNLAIFC